MPPQGQQQQQGGDNSMAPIWIMVLLFVTLYFVWFLGHKHIVNFIFSLNLLEIKLIGYFLKSQVLLKEQYYMLNVNAVDVTWDELVIITRNVNSYLIYPIMALLAILSICLYFSNITLKFRKTYTTQTLRKQEQQNWSSIIPVVSLDLANTDINTGPWAMALTPMEFARKFDLLRKEDMILDNPVPGEEMTAGIRKADAKRIFTLQLGAYWEGFENVPAHTRALAAIFMARINRDKSAAKMISDALDKASINNKPNFAVGDKILKKYINSELVRDILSRHAYLLTVMASLLLAARDDGVVPTAEFLWLKPVDRRLWYMLNCVGRQTPYAEVAGPFAHWKAELAMGRGALLPMVDEAIKALEIGVKQIKLTHKQLAELPLI